MADPVPDSPVTRLAVVDIGTNSVKLLVGDVTGGVVVPVLECSHQTRLGRGFYQDRRLQPQPIADTAAAVAAYARLAREKGARSIRAIATSAAREAVNTADLLAAVQAAAGLRVEVIDGDTEARWAFAGVMSDPRWREDAVLLLDVGGGSTEFILGRREDVRFRRSHRLGVVRLLEQLAPADPPQPAELARGRSVVSDFLEGEVAGALRPALAGFAVGAVRLVGTGGTASILGTMALELTRFDPEALDGCGLSREAVTRRIEQLWACPLAQRRQIPGLPPERADVILTGVLIYAAVMVAFGFGTLHITTRGLRYAALAGGH